MFSLTEFSVNDPESPKEHWVDMFSFYVQYWTARVNGSPLRRSKCFESHQASHTRPNRTGRSIVSPVSKICLLVGGFVVVQLLKSAVIHVICWSFSVFFELPSVPFKPFRPWCYVNPMVGKKSCFHVNSSSKWCKWLTRPDALSGSTGFEEQKWGCVAR